MHTDDAQNETAHIKECICNTVRITVGKGKPLTDILKAFCL